MRPAMMVAARNFLHKMQFDLNERCVERSLKIA